MAAESIALTLREILRQPDSWQQALQKTGEAAPGICAHLKGERPDLYLFTGCGTSYYLAIAAAGFFQEITGLPARALPGSELILSSQTYIGAGQKAALVAFSRSGETTETVVALREHRAAGRGPTVGITCRESCTMNGVADFTVSLPAADDKSVVMTSSFSTMLVGSVVLAAELAGNQVLAGQLRQLPDLLRSQLEQQRAFGQQLGTDAGITSFIYLGMGPFFGLACEAMLKLKEMTQVPCEAYSPLDFRHGPISIVGPGTLVAQLESDRAARQERQVLADVRKLGGATLLLGGAVESEAANRVYAVGAGLPEVLRGLLYMPLLQCTAYYRALLLGRDPDRPQHLTQVVTLDASSLARG